MSEMIIVIAILGILSGIVIISMQGSFEASREALARARVEMLNSGVHTYSTAQPTLYYDRKDGDIIDETDALRALQWRDLDERKAKPGSPYVPPEYNPLNSSSPDEYRIRWTGRLFELLLPGQPGVGFLMVFDGSDFTAPHIFDSDPRPGSR